MNFYKEMLCESSVPYAHIRSINKNGRSDLIFKDVNDAYAELLKKTKEDLINTSIYKFYTDKELRTFDKDFNKVGKYRYNMKGYYCNNNIFFNVEVYLESEKDTHILFRKVNFSHCQLNTVIRQSPFVAFVKDLEGRYLDVNESFLKIFNLKYSDVIGKFHGEIWGEAGTSIIYQQDKEVLEKNELVIFRDFLPIPNKGSRIYQTSKWPCYEANKVNGIIGIAIEITDKLKLKEVIERTEQNFMDMVNNIDEVIIIQDEKKALYISPYFKEMFGFDPSPLYDSISTWYTFWDAIEFQKPKLPFNNETISTNVVRIIKEGKVDKCIRIKYIPIFDEVGTVVRRVNILTDITEQENANEILEELRSEFFANISHELRTPINLIMSALQLIYCKLEDKSRTSVNKYLKIINQNSLRLIRLVNNLIDTTKISSGTFSYNPKNCDIISFVENITDSVVEFVERNNLEIIFDTDVEEKIIAFDLNHIERIVFNLISNAIKFNKPGGKIEVTISTKENVKITVKDTGIGIPLDKVDRIFERFEQVNKHNRREREGSGIGLSLVKSLVEMHNGTIQLNSRLYFGSEFIITLPDIKMNEEFHEKNISSGSLSKVNRMEVEFSDIYLELEPSQ